MGLSHVCPFDLLQGRDKVTDAAFPLYNRKPHALTDDKTLVASSETDWSSG